MANLMTHNRYLSCLFCWRLLLLVTVGIVYNRAGSSISVAINIKFDGENISFDAYLLYK